MSIPNYGFNYQEKQVADLPQVFPENPSCPDYQIGFCPPIKIDLNLVHNEVINVPAVFNQVSALTEEEVKDVLENFVSQKCCYGKDPVKKLKIIEMKSSSTYQYSLETFTETRKTTYVHEPYSNQVIINNGNVMAPPHPWDIPASPNQMFVDQTIKIEIPNTSQIEMCKKCRGRGSYLCSCHNQRKESCFFCNGSGKNNVGHNCHHCSGRGHKTCNSCSNTGYVVCEKCAGCGRLRWFLQLLIEFKNNRDDFFSKTEFIPDEKLKKCVASTIFSDTNLRVYPVNNHSNEYINEASSSLVNQHFQKFGHNCKILSQRHEIKCIPVTDVKHFYKEKMYYFIIYGLDNKVYAPNYPQKCCCTLL